MKKIAIVGTEGVPAKYGGFETLADNLAVYREQQNLQVDLTIFCSNFSKVKRSRDRYKGARLEYIALSAHGISSVFYDVFSILKSLMKGVDVLLILGVSGSIVIPVVKMVSKCKVITNIDGVEWKREKWGYASKLFLRFSEFIAVKFSDVVVADNQGIVEHVLNQYLKSSLLIPYGGDHALNVESSSAEYLCLPDSYHLTICRIEPENNLEMILLAFSKNTDQNIVIAGNWTNSDFGITLKQQFSSYGNLILLDPIYDIGVLKTLRAGAEGYIHGHGAGGTNPSLVEMMHFGLPIYLFDCIYNRHTTQNNGLYFSCAEDLIILLNTSDKADFSRKGQEMKTIANQKYTWDTVANAYFQLFLKESMQIKNLAE